MNKSFLSQLMDGAASPAIMLAVAVSQMNVEPNHKNTVLHRGQVTMERLIRDIVQQEPRKPQ